MRLQKLSWNIFALYKGKKEGKKKKKKDLMGNSKHYVISFKNMIPSSRRKKFSEFTKIVCFTERETFKC